MNLNFETLTPHEGGRLIDPRYNILFPWYTKPFLEKLISFNLSEWKVFEYGGGDSTIWWRKNCREIISVDTNKDWSEISGSFFCNDKESFINYPKEFINEEKFDCIIIDSEPVNWRDECVPTALECLKDGGLLIIDNYNQKTVELENWPIADKFLENKISEVFQNPGHFDWKTGYWIK
jgi:predicted O-methyltransferase YrrM